MARKALFRAVVVVVFILSALSVYGQDDPQVTQIQQKLKGQFVLTTFNPNRTDIVNAGTVVTLHKEGLLMYDVASPMPPLSTYKGGKISQGFGGFGRDLGITFRAPGSATVSSYAQRKTAAEEKVWITGCTAQKNAVVMQFYSDVYENVRYYGELKVPFPKGPTPSPEAVVTLIAEVVTPDNPIAEPSAQTQMLLSMQDGSDNGPAVPTAGGPGAAPKTVALGQTKSEVVAILGSPQRAALVGKKEIDYYPDMKVVFVDGKVADVQ